MVAITATHANAAIYPAYIDGTFTFGDPNTAAPYPLDQTFNLSSNPSATKTIFLDFTGHHSVNNSWGHNIVFPNYDLDGDPSIFSETERIEIQKIFQNVAEDYIPFNVNVTTRNPGVAALRRRGDFDVHWGVRVVMTQATAGFGVGIGGNAGPAGFDDPVDNPVFVFNKGARKGGQTATHEAGHSFGLTHDGLNSLEYHPGTGGFGRTSWGPIMGAPFDATISQWSNGDYAGATNFADDYSFITSRGFGFRTDDYLNDLSTPHDLTPNGRVMEEWGIIEDRNDRDYFRFTTGRGEVGIEVSGFAQDPNLDVGVVLYNDSGAVVAEFDPSVTPNIDFDIFLEAGSYTFYVDGVDNPGRYSDYGSVGFYQMEISIPLLGDLNTDGFLDFLDWELFIANAETDLSGLSSEDAYYLGDLDGDGFNSGKDFGLFKDSFIAENGTTAFAALFAVPEPSTSMLIAAALFTPIFSLRTKRLLHTLNRESNEQ